MSTRGNYGFYLDGKRKVTYSHSDSYPDGLGKDILDFISTSTVDEMKEIFKQIEMIDRETPPTLKQIEECEPWTNLRIGEQSTSDWYCLIREAQGNLDAYRDGLRYMLDSGALDNEYAYVINLDTEMLDFYSGGKLIKSFPLVEIYKASIDTIVGEMNDL